MPLSVLHSHQPLPTKFSIKSLEMKLSNHFLKTTTPMAPPIAIQWMELSIQHNRQLLTEISWVDFMLPLDLVTRPSKSLNLIQDAVSWLWYEINNTLQSPKNKTWIEGAYCTKRDFVHWYWRLDTIIGFVQWLFIQTDAIFSLVVMTEAFVFGTCKRNELVALSTMHTLILFNV